MNLINNFESIYNENKEDIFIFLNRSLRDEHLSSDILQDVFLNFIRFYKDKLIPPKKECRMILFRIARNLMINHYNSYYNRKVSLLSNDDSVKETSSNKENVENDVIKKIESQEIEKVMNELLSRLKEEYKTVLLLRYDQDLKLDVIGKIMNLSVSGVSRLLDRAEKALLNEGKKIGFQPKKYL